VLLTTHNMAEAEALCHRVGILREGRLVAIDTSSALRQRIAARRAVAVTFKGPVPDASAVLPASSLEVVHISAGWRVYTADPVAVAQPIAVRCAALRLELASFNTLEPSLKDLFHLITGDVHAPR
jgi:ABC-2 type transport system ATP-binding protein